ncbi:SspB family protein [Caenispirillum salinarum]|uniref:SspB family protein n=1 Tax=Caenispirillum salinarum TaxID=859058 RepID=UPI00384CEA1C
MTEHDDIPGFNYEEMVEDALRGVLRRALEITAAEGLPGEHHFYITFSTEAPGVNIPDRLRAQHPETMTIVLQHQYHDLLVSQDMFSVRLSFGGRLETLEIPFSAVTAFADPHAKFGLQFQLGILDDEDDSDLGDFEGFDDEDADVLLHDPSSDERPAAGPGVGGDSGDDDKGGDNVVTLDAFRKK